ncbi:MULTISPECIES: diacylglycerol kinase [Sporosarcina]|uniref:diacylglycerol kinase n=1 Tax=Sporosarcina TaxID=1569 RepID=UPI0005904EC8|nr:MULTISPECIES: diacylglycerol kinase [Sporosarcina]WJY27410.1 diacylglycerol kinase [Sporosarcina sp. 0.2-SM1T-5]
MKRARIIYNPTAGREAFRKNLAEVLIRLEQAGYEASAHATTCEGDATTAAAAAVERGFDLIIAAGGDGTLNEVVAGISGYDNRPPIGLIPMGTTNDFARALRIPRDIDKALDIILEDKKIPVDVGKMNDRFFINIAGGGRMTELTYEVPSRLKTMLGQLAYYLKGIEMLPSIHASRVKIEYDGEVFDDEAMLFLVGLTNSVGGFEKLAPESSINDGKFTVLILKKCNIAEFIRVVTLAVRGEHLNDPLVISRKAQSVKVTSEEEVLINLDGEYGGKTPAVFENLSCHIEMCVPFDQLREQDRTW